MAPKQQRQHPSNSVLPAGVVRFRALRPVNLTGVEVPPGEIVPGAEKASTIKQLVSSMKVEPVVADGKGGWGHVPYKVLRQFPNHPRGEVIADVTAIQGWERFRSAHWIGAVVNYGFPGEYAPEANLGVQAVAVDAAPGVQ